MSLHSVLEIARVQSNASVVSDALIEEMDNRKLIASAETISAKTIKFSIEHANSEETVALLSSLVDVSSSTIDLQILESACSTCAYIILNDDAGTEVASLVGGGELSIEVAAKPMDNDDEEDENHASDPDADVSEDDDTEELDEDELNDDDGRMHILTSEEAFKLATRLHSMACGTNKQDFPGFLSQMDEMLRTFRNRSGYEPSADQANASVEDLSLDETLAEFATLLTASADEFAELAKNKKKVKKGRSGFLSAYMKILGKKSGDIAVAWDHLDLPRVQELLSECGGDLLVIMEQERIARGLDKKEEEKPEENTEGDPAVVTT